MESSKIAGPLKRFPVAFPLTWLVVLPAGLWGIEQYYVAILGAFLDPIQSWAATLLIGVFVVLSLLAHLLAHLLAAQALHVELPQRIPLHAFGDPAQVWPITMTAGKEFILALAGPVANLILTGLAYLVWNAQVNPYLNVSMPFVALFNIWLAAVNVMPVYPLDCGRMIRVFLEQWIQYRPKTVRLYAWMGYLVFLAIAAWGVFLIVQQSRYSFETAGTTLLIAALLAAGLRMHPVKEGIEIVPQKPPSTPRPLRSFFTGVLVFVMLIDGAVLLPTNNGVEAPGVALSVEPMVELPDNLVHPHSGTFILTSVLSDAPIPAATWVLSKFNPAVRVLPPEKYEPDQLSPQESARQGFEMLAESETTALAVGLKLAGYPASIAGKGVRVDSIIPESHARGLLQKGDVITAVDGKPVPIQSDLTYQLSLKKAGDTVTLTVERGQNRLEEKVMLLPPAAPDNPPRIGIIVETAGFDASLPFEAKIVPQKIVGGPSAGLMFTLTIYNLLQKDDLTGGRRIAGTGTINPDGTVGPIGGVQQKVIAAEAAGAEYFLSPQENYADALTAAKHIKVVKVTTAEEAIAFLKGLK